MFVSVATWMHELRNPRERESFCRLALLRPVSPHADWRRYVAVATPGHCSLAVMAGVPRRSRWHIVAVAADDPDAEWSMQRGDAGETAHVRGRHGLVDVTPRWRIFSRPTRAGDLHICNRGDRDLRLTITLCRDPSLFRRFRRRT